MQTYEFTVRKASLHVIGWSDSVHTVKTDDLEAAMQRYENLGLIVVHTKEI